MQIEQFVMAYDVEQDRVQAQLLEDYKSGLPARPQKAGGARDRLREPPRQADDEVRLRLL